MKYLGLLTALVFLVGCGSSVSNFVSGALPNVPRAPASLPSGPMALQNTAGSIQAQSSNMALNATVSPTQRTVTSSQMSMQFTLHQERTTP